MELELKYIWIGEFRALNKFELNFCHSGEHNYRYDGSNLIITDNPKAPIDFGNNVSSITTIVGKNGSGKSSFCEIVLASVATLQNGSLSVNYYFDGIVCYGNILFVQKDLELNNKTELQDLGYEVVMFDKSPFEEMRHEWRTTYVRDGFVYYSNYIDRRNVQDENNLANISTSGLLQRDRSSPTPMRPPKSYENLYGRQDFPTQIEKYTIQEDYRYLRFILNFPELVPFIGDHMHVALDLTYHGNNKFINTSDHDDTISILRECERTLLELIQYEDRNDPERIVSIDQNEFKILFHRYYKLNLISTIYNSDKPKIDSELVKKFIYEDFIPSFFNDATADLLNLHLELVNDGRFIEEYSPFSYSHWFENTLDWRFYVFRRINIPFTNENKFRFKEFIALEEKVLGSEDYSERRISNYNLVPYLSSGEASYLSLFSRIYDIIRKNMKGYDDREKLILFIDEAEVGFHPDWSKSIIKLLLKFLNHEFNPYKIQLILTSHSPYLLSDLPKYNVRQFFKENNGNPCLATSDGETFGSNIYDLLSDSFFMENGFIGDFAQEKIDKCFELLNSESDVQEADREFIESIIEIIGEPLIKRQLVQLYDEKFKTNKELDFIDEQIERLKRLREERSKDD